MMMNFYKNRYSIDEVMLLSFQFVLFFNPLGNLAFLFKVPEEDVRLAGLEVDEGGKFVDLVFLVDTVVRDLDEIHVGIVKLEQKALVFRNWFKDLRRPKWPTIDLNYSTIQDY